MHSNYFMYTAPSNGPQINVNESNINLKQNLTTVTHQNATITTNNTNVIRTSAITQNALHHLTNSQQTKDNLIQPNIHVCQICCETFQKANSLKKHMKVHQVSSRDSDNSPYKCNACKIDYLHARAFEDHIKTEHGQPQAFKCVDCGCFRSVELTALQPFRCEGCAQRKTEPYENVGLINYRITSNQNATNTQVVAVNQIKSTRIDMDALIQNMRSPSETNGRRRKLHQCTECNKCYKHQSTLAMHRKIHSGEYKYKCQYCQKEFYLAEYYNRHMRVQLFNIIIFRNITEYLIIFSFLSPP